MLLSRKKFLQQTGLACASAMFPYSKLVANCLSPKSIPDSYHPVDCTSSLGTGIYNYSEDKIQVDPGFYSKLYNGGYDSNGFCNDVEYNLEGEGFDQESCGSPTANDCRKVDFNTNNNPFRYNVYYVKPEFHNYEARQLPVCIFFHAGGFMECSTYLGGNIVDLCMFLARKGYICFSVEYRRGRIIDFTNSKISVQQQMARYRAIQDGCGAIRSVMKKNIDGDFSFKFDATQFFVGGMSAGAIIALGCAYYRTSTDLVTNQNMIDSSFPKASGSNTLKSVLGNMHADYYYAPVNPDYWPTIAGVISLWGGFVIPWQFDGGNDYGTS